MKASKMIDLLYKEASSKNSETDDIKNNIKRTLGVTAVAGGATAVNSAYNKGHLTGRETLWHNTDKKNVDSILDKGILSTYSEDPENITQKVVGSRLSEEEKKKLIGKVYMGRNKQVAMGVGTQAEVLGLSKERKTLKAKVPTWLMKEVENPELHGAKNAKELKEVFKKHLFAFDEKPEFVQDFISKAYFDGLGRKGTATFEGDISAKYLKGSKHYQKATLDEIRNFIKHNPKRFLKGIGTAGLGTASVIGGGKLLYDSVKSKDEWEKTHKQALATDTNVVSFEKVALNASKAREMAKKVGLIPEGQWKWALRNLRGAKGELLKGKELAKAKEGMGALPNNIFQKLVGASERMGHRKEIGIAFNKGDPVLPKFRPGGVFNEKQRALINAAKNGDFETFKKISDTDVGEDYSRFRRRLNIGKAHSVSMPDREIPDIYAHTHPMNKLVREEGVLRLMKKYRKDDMTKGLAQDKKLKRKIEGYERAFKMPAAPSPGDIKNIMSTDRLRPESIVDPRKRIEGVHKKVQNKPLSGIRAIIAPNQIASSAPSILIVHPGKRGRL